MRTVLFFVLLHFSSIITAQKNLQVSPLFQRVITHTDDKVYDTRAWSVYTGSPVRATPLVKRQFIYVGNANGDFFAIDKKNGRVKWKYHTGEAIHSSAIGENGKLFFQTTNKLYMH